MTILIIQLVCFSKVYHSIINVLFYWCETKNRNNFMDYIYLKSIGSCSKKLGSSRDAIESTLTIVNPWSMVKLSDSWMVLNEDNAWRPAQPIIPGLGRLLIHCWNTCWPNVGRSICIANINQLIFSKIIFCTLVSYSKLIIITILNCVSVYFTFDVRNIDRPTRIFAIDWWVGRNPQGLLISSPNYPRRMCSAWAHIFCVRLKFKLTKYAEILRCDRNNPQYLAEKQSDLHSESDRFNDHGAK